MIRFLRIAMCAVYAGRCVKRWELIAIWIVVE